MRHQKTSSSETAAKTGIDQLIADEVRTVKQKKGGRVVKVTVVILLCLIVAGISSYYFQTYEDQRSKSEIVDQIKHYPIPQRPEKKQTPMVAEVTSESLPAAVPMQTDQISNPSDQQKLGLDIRKTKSQASANLDSQIKIGPFLASTEISRVEEFLKLQDLSYRKVVGVGDVEMIRLREGRYDVDVAHKRLKELHEKYKSAFILPYENKLDIYLASFHSRHRANKMMAELEDQGYSIQMVPSTVQLERTLLLSDYMTADKAQHLLLQLQREGVNAEMKRKRS
jgi:cell division septation protein DedD